MGATPCAASGQHQADPWARRLLRLRRDDGAVLLRRRPPSGLLGGMMELPTGDWREGRRPAVSRDAPGALDWQQLPGQVRHTFTHFHLELTVFAAAANGQPIDDGADTRWVQPTDFGDQALPSVMQKVARHALTHLAGEVSAD